MKVLKRLSYLLVLISAAALMLSGCGGGGSSTSAGGGAVPAKITVEGSFTSPPAKLASAGGDMGTIKAIDAKTAIALGTGAIDSGGKYTVSLTVPDTKFTLVLTATVDGKDYRAVSAIDLSSPPALADNVVTIYISKDTEANVKLISTALGLTGGGLGVEACNKDFTVIATAVKQGGGNYIAYTSTGLSFIGAVSGIDAPAAPVTATLLVKDTSGSAVEGATVYAIPAADLEAIASQPITLTTGNYTAAAQKVDEPLEDLINGNYTPTGSGVATYKKGVTDASGKAVITDLPAGSSDKYFVYVKPASTDTGRLPGGSLCRTAVLGSTLGQNDNATNTIKVSTTPTSAATYIGSSLCILCHSSYATAKQTLHKLGIMATKSPSGLQDIAKFSSTTDPDQDFFAGLKKFESGTTVYYYNFSSSANTFKTLASNPTAAQIGTDEPVYFTLTLSKAGDVYKVTFTNIITPADPNNGMVKDVALTYGGGLHKQRYVTKLGNSLYVIPIQFNSQGSDSSADAGRTTWLEYNTVSAKWWNASTKVFIVPNLDATGLKKSFDINCAGCHYNGYSVTKNSSNEYMATGAADYQGEVNPVTGVKEELNIGCESCHGPGSEHKKAGGQGKFIVTPKNLTPERETMICGQCHTRSKAKDTDSLGVEAPLNAVNKMMMPGSSRAQYLANHVSRHDADSSAGDLWGDKEHAKKHHQQYTDFIQTSKYRNNSKLMTCASCHDVHAPGTDRRQLSGTSDNSLCKSCHTTVTDVATHMTDKTGFNMGSTATCIECHVSKTAKSGSGNPTSLFTGVSGTKYYQNDISSHLFDVPLKTSVSATNAMPIPYTDSCGACHQNGRLSKQ